MHKTYLDFRQAVVKSLETAQVTTLKEIINLEKSIGRVLSSDILCSKNLPSFNNSAMDGFAIRACDAGKTLDVAKTILAGVNHEASLRDNQCYKIMTGAKVPSDVDTIIPIEDVEFYQDEKVTIKKDVKKGACLRLKGEEQAIGNTLYSKGEVITSAMCAVLASQGLTMIKVYKQLSIAVLSTGNELREPWEEANEDEIYNCNSYALITLLKEKGFDATYKGVGPDNLEASIEYVKSLKSYDVVLTTGGISAGDADFMAEAFTKNGLETIFHGVNIKPGRPIMMGTMKKVNTKGETFVMCLPGNPLTAMVNMHLFAIPVLNKIQGNKAIYHDYEVAINQTKFKTKTGRVNVVLGTCNKGEYEVTQDNRYGSGMITVLSGSNSILVTEESKAGVEVNESVRVIKFNCSYLKEQTNIFN